MTKSTKASSRVAAANRDAAAAAAESKNTIRNTAIGSGAVENVARRQFQKTQAAAVQAHARARGQRQQARRDAR